MVALSRNVARKHAMEMLLTGDMISADDAYRIGLVNRVVEPGAARDEALKLARKIAAKSAAVVKLGKEAFYRQLEMGVVDAYGYADRSDGQEHDGARRRGGHFRVRREAPRRSGRIGDDGSGPLVLRLARTAAQEFIARMIAAQRRRRRGVVKSRKARSFGGGCRPPG